MEKRIGVVHNHRVARAHKGAVLVEGVMGLWLVVAGVVLMLLLVLATGFIAYYKVKMQFIAQRAARYAADLPLGTSDLNTPTSSVVARMLADIGLPNNSFNLSVNAVTVGGEAGAQVQLSLTRLRLPGNGTVIPPFIDLTETAAAPRDAWVPEGILVLSCRHTNNTKGGPNTAMAIPTFGRYTSKSGKLQSITQQDTGVAYWPNSVQNTYYMSFPNGGWNTRQYAWFDYAPEGGRGKAAPPADYPTTEK